MTAPTSVAAAGTAEQAEDRERPAARGYWRRSWSTLRENHIGLAAGGVLAVLALFALAAPLVSAFVTHTMPEAQDLGDVFGGPSLAHPLGTDELGRDVLTRLVYGAQVSLGVGFLAVALVVLVGGAVGLLAGFYGGVVDDVLMRLVDALLAIPTIYLLILVTGLLPFAIGPAAHPWVVVRHDAISLAVLVALTSWGGLARLVRGQVLRVEREAYIVATRSIGAGDLRLIVRHVLPNVLSVVIVAASLAVGGVILLEAALDFVGLGVQPPTPSWGNMLTEAQTYFFRSAALVVLPGALIFLAVTAANVFGNALRDALDPRLDVR